MGIALDTLNKLDELFGEEYVATDLQGIDFDNIDLESFEEGIGNLKGLSKHLIQTITQRGGGENSAVQSSGKIKSNSELHKHIHAAIKAGQTAVVYKNGKPVSAVHPSSYGSKYNVSNDTKEQSQSKSKYIKSTRYTAGRTHRYEDPEFGSRDAIDHATRIVHGNAEPNYKDHNVEVKSYAVDKNREALHQKRSDNRPDMQYNTVKRTPAEVAAERAKGRYYVDIDTNSRKETSMTPAGSFDKIKDAAALRLARLKLGDKGSPVHKAMELHDQLGKHLASGNSEAARKTANELSDHIRQSGLHKEHRDIERYADSLKSDQKDMGKSYKASDWEKKQRAHMRGENESLAHYTLCQLEELFGSEETQEKLKCPKCGGENCERQQSGKCKCLDCKEEFAEDQKADEKGEKGKDKENKADDTQEDKE
jgi:ribosomal protein L37AE/L43A